MPDMDGEDGGGGKGKKGGGRPRSGALDAFDISEPISDEQALQMELEKVKTEREKLLQGIAACKEPAGVGGCEAQEEQIKLLLQELQLKKAKLNELLLEAARKDQAMVRQTDETKDCVLNTPDGTGPQLAYIEALKQEADDLITDLQDADAKNRLYMLLSDRTRCVLPPRAPARPWRSLALVLVGVWVGALLLFFFAAPAPRLLLLTRPPPPKPSLSPPLSVNVRAGGSTCPSTCRCRWRRTCASRAWTTTAR